jgi:DNA-binding NtrC family response regulator
MRASQEAKAPSDELDPAWQPASPRGQVSASVPRGRIVIVDDEMPVLIGLSAVLSKANYQVVPFTSAAEALKALAELPDVELLLSDLKMPEMDGLDLLAQVRERWPELPVIVMTGDSSAGAAVEALRLGAYDYLCKPFREHAEIPLRLERALERRRLIERNQVLERRLELAERFGGVATAEVIALQDRPPSVRPQGPASAPTRTWNQPFAEAKAVIVSTFERQYVESVMLRTEGNVTESARLAGMDRANFRRLARRHAIDLDAFRSPLARSFSD